MNKQKRKSFRIEPDKENLLRARVRTASGEESELRVFDISEKGISLALAGSTEGLPIGKQVSVKVHLGHSGEINVDGVIKNMMPYMNTIRCGIEFQNLRDLEKRKLLQYIHARDLEARKG